MILRTDLRAGQGGVDLSALSGMASDYLATANLQAEDVTNLLATAGIPGNLLSNLPATLPSELPAQLGIS